MSRRNDGYADALIAEWGIGKCSTRLQTQMRRVLGELSPGAQLVFRRNPKLQVVAVSETAGHYSVWAYFPIHRRRQIARDLELNPTARVLLVICEKLIAGLTDAQLRGQLRDHLGHTLLYLRSPKARNECADAAREWRLERGDKARKAATRDVRRLRITQIRLDFQPAECLIEETVQTYVDRLKRGERLKPLRVRFDGMNYFLEDGFHRLEAARRLRLKTVEARILPGTLAEMEAEYGDYLKRLRIELRRKRERIRSLRVALSARAARV